MTASVLQEVENSTQTSAATSAATLTVSAGSYLDIYAAVDNVQTQNGIAASGAASTGLTFTLVDSANDTGNGQRQYHWVSNQATASGGSLTITVTWSASVGFNSIWVKEIGGSSGYNGTNHASNLQAAPGTGTDAVTTGLLGTIATVPALISALSYTTISGGSGGVLSAGTGYAAGSNGWTFGSAANNAKGESLRVTAGTSIAATYTLSQANVTITQAAVFTESAGDTLMPMQMN